MGAGYGGAGFLGSHLCERLLSEGYRVVGKDNLRTGYLENVAHLKEETHFEYIDHDVTSHMNIGGRCWQMGVAEVVDHNIKCSEEGAHIDHEESVPFPWGSGSKPTLAGGHLPIKLSLDNSHQAGKVGGYSA